MDFFDTSPASQAEKYAFKCHRAFDPSTNQDIVYPVNALAFHPIHGTFASGGGDGVVAFWDAAAKKRLRQYSALPGSVATLAFNKDGQWMAIGTGDGFEHEPGPSSKSEIFLREISPTEGLSKSRK